MKLLKTKNPIEKKITLKKKNQNYQWMCHVHLDNILWHPMKSLAWQCDDRDVEMLFGDPFFSEQKTPCRGVQKFSPENIDKHLVLPTDK